MSSQSRKPLQNPKQTPRKNGVSDREKRFRALFFVALGIMIVCIILLAILDG